MDRWSRWQVYLFWGSMAAVMGALGTLAVLEASEGLWHHVWLVVPPVLLVPFSAYLYVERARSLASLKDSERRYRLLTEEASDPIFVSDLSTRGFVDVNRRALTLTGYSRDELMNMSIDDLIDSESVDTVEARQVVAQGELFRAEETIVRKSGEKVPVEVSASAVSDGLVQAIVRPISERKKEEEKLRKSETVFRAVSEMTSDYVYSMKVEPDGSLIPEWLTGAYERVTGYTMEESIARGGWQALLHPDDISAMGPQFERGVSEGGTVESEFRIIAKSGEVRHLRSWARFERDDPDGPVVRIVGAVSDVTEQKTLEANLGASERRFEELYERLPIGLYRGVWNGPRLDANAAFIEMFGYPDMQTLLEVEPEMLYADPADRKRWADILEEFRVIRNFEVQYRRFDGTTFWGRNTARLDRSDQGDAFIEGAIIDITEEKKLDEELRATLRDLQRADVERRRLLTHLVKAKEEERKRVASDIHDDSVQVMTAVAIDLERLSRKGDDSQLQRSLEELEGRVRDAVGRLRTMVFELRPPMLDQEGVGSALRLYLEEFTIDTGIEYELRFGLDHEPSNPTRVVLYRIAQEALTNVRKHSGATRVVVAIERRDGGIGMTVSDDGKGFDVLADDLISPGHIGLSEMRERAEISGGRFEITSDLGRGTRVGAWLPELTV